MGFCMALPGPPDPTPYNLRQVPFRAWSEGPIQVLGFPDGK